jgi:hypothetical protein
VQYPLTGTYCVVIILMVSCATMPPRKAAVLGSSAVGARALKRDVMAGVRRWEGGLQLSDGVVELLGQLYAIAYDALHLFAKAFNGRR